MAKYTTLSALFTGIANSIRRKTGGTEAIVADDFPDIIDSLSTGGITPIGTKTITKNGTYDVTSYASAEVIVPETGIVPSGELNITENGTHDVTDYASATVNITGLNARILTATVSADKTSGDATIITDEWLKTVRDDPNGFVWMRFTGVTASTAMLSTWLTTNFTLCYNGGTAYNSALLRTTSSATNLSLSTKGLPGANYNCHININSSGSLMLYGCNTTYPLRKGTYQIIAGTVEML